jgi:hypothetical protein
MIPLLLLQAVAGPFLPAAPRPRSDKPCPVGVDPSEIVVCARDPEIFRLRPLPGDPPREGLPRAAVRVGDATLAAEAEQATLAGGAQSQRLMFRLKLPVGRGKQ